MQGTEAQPAENRPSFRFVVGSSSDSLSLTDCDKQKDPTMAHEILAVLAEMAQCHGSELRAQLWQH